MLGVPPGQWSPHLTENLPTGTVTFLFTDIENSTPLLERLGADRYRKLTDEHAQILRRAIAEGKGYDLSTAGDSFFAVFKGAPAAVEAAVAAQKQLASHDWPEDAKIRVRMGLHTGDGSHGGDNYVGLDVNIAARIEAAGHGEQILISGATAGLIRRSLPANVGLTDLGPHRLKGIAEPEQIFQVTVEGSPADFPAIKTLGSRPNNLPAQLTSFVGRETELTRLKELLKAARCLSLTGPGGTGKTRLSLELAREASDDFEDGTFFVQLASVIEPDMVATTIAETLHLPETRGEARAPQERLIEHLSGRRMLLVLDNFEQVVAAAGVVSDLLRTSDGLKVVVTTRIPLHIQGEHEYPVPPLVLPDPKSLPDAALLSQYESVALFIERAVTVKPDFKVTNQNAPAVAEICARLDGLPLAIELAAARVRVLTPEALLARLSERLKLLVGGATDIPKRQQTLRGAIEWSFDLLDEPERRLFQRFSVFVGGGRLEEAESVCGTGDSAIDVFDGISSLVDKSLVKTDESDSSDVRFFMLETIREYAKEKLDEGDEKHEIGMRHATAYTELAELAAPRLFGQSRRLWLDRLARDYDNLRAAHTWAVSNQDVDLALRLVIAIWRFWHMRGYLQEGKRRVDEALALSGSDQQTPLGARALQAAGGVTHWQADTENQIDFYDRAVALWRQLGDDEGLADALYDRSFPSFADGDMEKGRVFAQESFALAEKIGNPIAIAKAQWALAMDDVYSKKRDFSLVESRMAEAMRTFREEDNAFMQMWGLHFLGQVSLMQNRNDEAETQFREAMRFAADAMDVSGILFQLDNLSASARHRGDLERAIRLAAAASALKTSSGADLVDASREMRGWQAVGREALTESRLEEIWAEAERWNLEEAISSALQSP